MHLLLHKPYTDAIAPQPRPDAQTHTVPKRGRPPSAPRRLVALGLARAARALDGEAARRAVA